MEMGNIHLFHMNWGFVMYHKINSQVKMKLQIVLKIQQHYIQNTSPGSH